MSIVTIVIQVAPLSWIISMVLPGPFDCYYFSSFFLGNQWSSQNINRILLKNLGTYWLFELYLAFVLSPNLGLKAVHTLALVYPSAPSLLCLLTLLNTFEIRPFIPLMLNEWTSKRTGLVIAYPWMRKTAHSAYYTSRRCRKTGNDVHVMVMNERELCALARNDRHDKSNRKIGSKERVYGQHS